MQVTRIQSGIPSAAPAMAPSAYAPRILPSPAANAAPSTIPTSRLACGAAFVAARG